MHGGLRYLENGEFRLVNEALAERKWWLDHVTQHARSIALWLPVEVLQQMQSILKKLKAIRNAALSPDEELPELTQNQFERIEAFELHVQMREDQRQLV